MNKLRLLTLNFLLLTVVGLFAGYNKTTYYSNANGKSGATLKTALCTIINGTCDGSSFQQIEYGSGKLNGVWGAFQTTDCNGTTIIDRYSSITSFTVGDDQAGNYSEEGDVYNREHSFPKSWFGGSTSKGPGTDLFHIFPTDGYVNSKRGANPFGEVKNATYTSKTSGGWCSKLGTGGYGSNTNYTVFEPADRWKGDFARAYFYMVTCYENSIVSWYNNYSSTEVKYVLNGTKHPAFQTWQLQMLLAWAEADPVDDIETARNEAVMAQQHNRNPFIDFPGLEQYIWGSYSTSYSSYQTTALSVSNYVDPYGNTGTDTPSISISLASMSVAEGGTASLTATVSNASGATVTWTTSDSDVASLNPTTGNSTTVEGLSAGTATITASINVDGTTYSATCVVTVTSTGGGNTSGDYYAKVTSSSDLTSGQYLIVYEEGNVAFNGGLSTLDAISNTISVTPSNSQIAITSDTEAAEFTIDTSTGTIKSASGLYIGNTSNSNTLTGSSTTLTNTISISSGDANIVSSGGAYLRYNNTSGQTRFRYYKSSSYSSQKAIQLYKKVESSGGSTTTDPVDPTIGFTVQSVSLTVGDTYTQTVNTNSDGAVTYSVSPTSVATIESSTGKVTAVGVGTATVTATTVATDNYNFGTATYQVTVSAAAVPSIAVIPSMASIEVDGTVTLSATTENASSATITWSCSPSGIVSLDTTPGSNVTVTGLSAGEATVTASITVGNTTYTDDCTITVTASGGSSSENYYAKVTSAPDDWSGTYLIVCENANVALNGGLTTLDAAGNTISVSPSNNQISITSETEAAEFTIASKTDGYSLKSKSGLYIGHTGSSNALKSSTSYDFTNTISLSNGDVTITCNSKNLRYNASIGQTRFRYFGSDQTAIQLYKKVASSGTEPETPVTTTTGSGTADDPYTVADVLLLFNNSSVPSNAVYVRGVVSEIVEVSTGYHNATYYISENGATDNQFYVFRGKYLEGANFTSTDQLQVGDTVVINGTLTTYNTTNEFAANNYIVSLVRPVVAVDPEVSFAVTSKDMKVGDTYTLTVSTNSDGTVTYSSSNTAVATVDAEGMVTAVGAGSATITATVAATSSYNEGSAEYSVTVTRNTPTTSFATLSKSMEVGDEWTQAVTTNSDGTVTYTSSDTSVATVDAEGKVTAVGAGSATITASTAQSTAYDTSSATYTVTVSRKVATLSFDVSAVSIDEDETYMQEAIYNGDGEVVYSSSDTNVATVDFSTGEVTAVGVGTATITATSAQTTAYDGATATYQITVNAVILLGDVDNNDKVDSADLAALVQILLGGDTANYNMDAADVDGQNGITLADLTALVNLLKTIEE